MKLFFLALFFIATAAAEDVVELKTSDFDSKLEKYDIALVMFYAPWCGHCKKLKPEFEKAATKLKTDDPPVQLAKIDCTVEKEICEKFKVTGYPTLKIFRKGHHSQDYEGPRETEGIIKYMRGQAGPSSKELKTYAEFEKVTKSDDTTIIGFFETKSKLQDSFHKVADTDRDRFRFAHTSEPSILEKVGFKDDIVAYVPKKLHNKFDPPEFRYDGNYDTDKIREFLVHETNGLAGIRTLGNLFQYEKRPLFVVYYKVDYTLNPKGSNYWRNRVMKVAKEFQRKAYFAVSNKDDFMQEIEEYGLGDRKDSDEPIVAAHTDSGKYPMNKEFSIENLESFVQSVLAGKAESYLKSEPVPESQGDVKVIVAKSFKEMVMDVDKDVLIEFYAPWCGHCKALAPKYDELGSKMADEDVVIAKMDATANDVPPQFQVRGFPTLYFVPKNTKKPVAYNGGREVDDFIKYIAEHSTDGLKGYTKEGKKKKAEL